MESFSVATEDFLANGFYQLYNELQDSEYPIEFDVLPTEPSTGATDPPPEEPPLTLPTTARDLELEVNVENFILEHSCVDFSQIWDNDIQLPEKTFLCDDSCESFLRLPVITEDTGAGEPAPEPDTGSCTFTCPFENCRKVYAKPVHLKAHLRRHVGDKPYQCKWPNCKWRFSRSDELARHFRSHSGVKPYKCDYCPKCFSRSDHLAKHRKVHERKLAASKHKGAWISLPRGRPGRKPKLQVAAEKVSEECPIQTSEMTR